MSTEKNNNKDMQNDNSLVILCLCGFTGFEEMTWKDEAQ